VEVHDVITSDVVPVNPQTPTSVVASTLRDHAISAMPVVDEVSEGDLIGRDEAARQARLDWWLTLTAGRSDSGEDFLASLRTSERRAGGIISTPVITVGETPTSPRSPV
jgi:CBS domain-containing protein